MSRFLPNDADAFRRGPSCETIGGRRIWGAVFGRRKWLAGVVLAGVGCRAGSRTPERARLVIFAAASLRDVFAEMAARFELVAPGVEVSFNFAGTQELRAQLEHGAQVDVFASADIKQMAALVQEQLVREPVVFADNEPVLVVGKDVAEVVTTFDRLPQARRIVLGAEDVPIGRYTARILERASQIIGPDFGRLVSERIVSRELSVRHVLTKVLLGEADAGIVYRTDARGEAEGRLLVVDIPKEVNVVAEYPMALLVNAPNESEGQRWIDFVLSSVGSNILSAHGFGVPAGRKGPR